VDGFGLSEKQYEIVRNLHLGGGHKFLVVQGSHSVVCCFDLSDLPEHLLILSGNKDNVRLLDQIRSEVGDDPKAWMPVLRQRALGPKYQPKLRLT
jgi:type IV secretion system protein VirB4